MAPKTPKPPITPANDMDKTRTTKHAPNEEASSSSAKMRSQDVPAREISAQEHVQPNPLVYVCPLSLVPFAISRHQPSHLVTLLDPEIAVPTPQGILPERHLRLGVHDVAQQRVDLTHPTAEHVENLLKFISRWDRRSPLLIHCFAGISRSTAAAFVTMCKFNEPGHEHEIAWALRVRAPHAQPNRLIVALADEILGRRGRMVRAVDAIGPGQVVFEGDIFGVPLRPGI
jgi:predicted protein tyrosine phosphatase